MFVFGGVNKFSDEFSPRIFKHGSPKKQADETHPLVFAPKLDVQKSNPKREHEPRKNPQICLLQVGGKNQTSPNDGLMMVMNPMVESVP